jgi:hypothetical protein
MRTRTYMPSEARIKEECAKIQAGWSPEERAKRWVARTVYRLTIKVAGTGVLSQYLLEEGIREMHNWPYLEDGEVKKRKEQPAVEQPDVEEEFHPSTVSFG